MEICVSGDPYRFGRRGTSKTEFRTESIILTGPDKLKLRGLFQDAGIAAKASDDLEAKATEYLTLAETLARKAGGAARPRGQRPAQGIAGRSGHAQARGRQMEEAGGAGGEARARMGEAAKVPERRRGRGCIDGSGDGGKGHPRWPAVPGQLRPCASLAETGRADVARGGDRRA